MTPAVGGVSLTWHVGDTRKVLATMEPASVDLVLTSPPFLALRSYLPADHPDKADEIGSEATPGAFIDTLLDVVEACERVLAPHGSLCFELGDTYSGSGGAGGDYAADGLREGQAKFDGSNHRRGRIVDHDSGRRNPGPGWPIDKSLCLIPELFRVALVYGVNPLTGRTTPRWRARNVVRWCRPNPPVGALGDKFRPGTSEMVVVCKSRTRYFDLDAVRNPNSDMTPGGTANSRQASGDGRGQGEASRRAARAPEPNPAGAPPLDWWEIPTQGYPGSHYATWPKALLLRPIKAMCPEKVCRTCGEPSRRIVERESFGVTSSVGAASGGLGRLPKSGVGYRVPDNATRTTLGWTDCGHDDYRPGVVLDPFAGSGTTLDVAHGLGRSAVGIDLDPRNVALAQDRLGMFPIGVVAHDPTPCPSPPGGSW